MVWRYKYGDDYDFYLKLEKENEGNPNWKIPLGLSSLPEIHPIYDKPYVEAFYLLDASRQTGMGLGAIPLSEITNLYDRIQFGDERDFISIIQAADMAYLKAYNEDPKNKVK